MQGDVAATVERCNDEVVMKNNVCSAVMKISTPLAGVDQLANNGRRA